MDVTEKHLKAADAIGAVTEARRHIVAEAFAQLEAAAIAPLKATLAERDTVIAEMRTVIDIAAGWFEEYADAHAVKAGQAVDSYERADRKHKAVKNAERAATLRAALQEPRT